MTLKTGELLPPDFWGSPPQVLVITVSPFGKIYQHTSEAFKGDEHLKTMAQGLSKGGLQQFRDGWLQCEGNLMVFRPFTRLREGSLCFLALRGPFTKTKARAARNFAFLSSVPDWLFIEEELRAVGFRVHAQLRMLFEAQDQSNFDALIKL